MIPDYANHKPKRGWQHFPADGARKTPEMGALRRYDLLGSNGLRRMTFHMIVFAASNRAALTYADQIRRDENKVRAESWRSYPAI